MGTVRLDLDGLLGRLREREYYSLPLEFTPRSARADLVELRAVVAEAIGVAVGAAILRVPDDPTNCSEPTVALTTVVCEIDDGPMTEEEVTAFLHDLTAALDGRAINIAAPRTTSRVPWQAIESWAHGPELVPTAFAYFSAPRHVAPNGGLFRELAPEVLIAVSDHVERWTRLPHAMTTLSRGGEAFVVPDARVTRELRAVYAQQLRLNRFTLTPRRYSHVEFSFNAVATLQLFDDTRTAAGCLQHLLEAFRVLGPWLDYAFVRMDRPVLPSLRVWAPVLGRGETEGETCFHNVDAPDRYVVGACVAQVLGPRHLQAVSDFPGFTSEQLGNGRVLITAQDVAPWINGPNPEPDVLRLSEPVFQDLTLTTSQWDRISAEEMQRRHRYLENLE